MLLKRSVVLKTHRKTCIYQFNINKVTGSTPKTYYPAIKEMLAILALSFASDSVTVFTSCKP